MRVAAFLAGLLLAGSALAQTALRPDQIVPGTPDIVTGMVGSQFQIKTTIPWRSDTTASPVFVVSDNARVVELTFNGPITALLPDATFTTLGADWNDGTGFTIQVRTGTLTLNRTSLSTINGKTSITVGPYQSVALYSRSGDWYAVFSLPQSATAAGDKALSDKMIWQVP